MKDIAILEAKKYAISIVGINNISNDYYIGIEHYDKVHGKHTYWHWSEPRQVIKFIYINIKIYGEFIEYNFNK